MYVFVHHTIKAREDAFTRGQKLMKGEGAPAGTRVLQFYPASDGSIVTCLWEGPSVGTVKTYVDDTMGRTSEQSYYEVDASAAFARQPLGLSGEPVLA